MTSHVRRRLARGKKEIRKYMPSCLVKTAVRSVILLVERIQAVFSSLGGCPFEEGQH